MVEILLILVLLIGICAGIFLKIASSFGGVKPFLANELKEERATLTAHRKKAKALEKSTKSELSSVTKDLKSAQKEYDKRVNSAATKLESLLNPGKGAKVARVGKVYLFEHEIEVRGNLYSLNGLQISTNITPNAAMLTLLFSNGMKLVETYDTSWRDAGEGKQKRDFTHEEIIQFETMINNHIIVEEDFVRMLPEMIEEASNTLSDEKENTHAIDVANENLQHQEGGSQIARDAKIAKEELAAQEAVYKVAVEAFLNGKV
jgi:hypothetical protein